MAMMMTVFSKHTEKINGKKVTVVKTRQVDRTKLKQKLGHENYQKFLEGYPFKIGDYVVTIN